MNTLLSGGAIGADTLFDECARAVGHTVVHFSFKGHSTTCSNICLLEESNLREADLHLKIANKTLKRYLNLANITPKGLYVTNLLRRNYFQIKDSTAVYAVSWLDRDLQMVEGGTAWAVTMGINKGIPVYLFDQYKYNWHSYSRKKWVSLAVPPKPQGIYTGIGTRELSEKGISAIRALYC